MKVKSIQDSDISTGDLVSFPKGSIFYEDVPLPAGSPVGTPPKFHTDILDEEKIMCVLDSDCRKDHISRKNMYKVLYKNKVYYMSNLSVSDIEKTLKAKLSKYL